MKQLILRMGGSYMAQNFPGAIGHLMQSTGIEDIMVETDVFLRGTANTIISGKDYYAMLRAHTVTCGHVYPTLEGIRLMADSRRERHGLYICTCFESPTTFRSSP